MNAGPLVMSLRSRGVVFVVDDPERVRLRHASGQVSVDEIAFLREHRAEVLAVLAEMCRGCGAVLYQPESQASGYCVTCRSPARGIEAKAFISGVDTGSARGQEPTQRSAVLASVPQTGRAA